MVEAIIPQAQNLRVKKPVTRPISAATIEEYTQRAFLNTNASFAPTKEILDLEKEVY